jgi:tetratricopeptide (TPR) repeat protein
MSTKASFDIAVGRYYLSIKNDPSTAMTFFKKALSLAQSCGDTKHQSNSLTFIADLEWHIGNYFSALKLACEASRVARLSANVYVEANTLRIRGLCCLSLGNYKDSIAQLRKARKLLERCGISRGDFQWLTILDEAQVHALKSEYLEATSIYSQIASTSVQQCPSYNAVAMLNLAEIGVFIGAAEHDVLGNLHKAQTIFETHKIARGLIYCDITTADLQLREGNTSTAKTLFQKCLNLMRGKESEMASFCLERLADITAWGSADLNSACPWTMIYLSHSQKGHKKLALHRALLFLGDLFFSSGDEGTAHSLFIVALEGFTLMDIHQSRAQCMIRLGDLANKHGDLPNAIEHWRAARPLFERSLQAKDIANIDLRLATVEEDHKET